MLVITEADFDVNYLRLLLWRFKTFFMHYNTPKKFTNLVRIKIQKLLRVSYITGFPYELIVEISSKCTLKCPNCLSHNKSYPHTFLSFEEFKKILDIYAPYIYNVELFSWGEPFLNKDIYNMISYAKEKKVFTRISTNFNIISLRDIKKIIGSGLDYVKISIDGASPMSYQKYRKKGDFKKVIYNLKNLIKIRKQIGIKTPVIEWQYIVNRYNEHELEKAKLIATNLGIDRITFMNFSPIHIHAENNIALANNFLPRNIKFRKWESVLKPNGFAKKGNCCYLWESRVISSRGRVNLCPNRIGSVVDTGNGLLENQDILWNSSAFIVARQLFRKTKIEPANMNIPCISCREFEQPWKCS